MDDDTSILRSFSKILQKCGYEIETAATGKEAMGKTRNRHFDLLLLDLRLPDMQGTDVLVKSRKQLDQTVKIMITGFPSLESGVKALEEGVDGYLVKPVHAQELLTLINDKLDQPIIC